MKTYRHSPYQRFFVSLSPLVILILLLAACGGSTPSGKTVTPTPSSGAVSTTVPMPPTQTSCPPVGTVRAAVMAPLAQGSQNTLVYAHFQGPASGEPTAVTLKRYTVSTRATTDIVTLPHNIGAVQISADGQWLLFHTFVSQQVALQLIRMDGQGLQTLYCSKSGSGGFGWIQWSPDKKYVALVDTGPAGSDQSAWTFTLLNVATGTMQTKHPDGNHVVYLPLKWLDNTHLYTSSLFPQVQNLYLFDANTDTIQPILTSPPLGPPCFDAVNSVDSTQLFSSVASTCEPGGDRPVRAGPSSIQVRPAMGGATRTVYSTPTEAITALRAASRTTLLFLIQNVNADSSHNGLWKVNTDGTGLTRLISEAALISNAANEEIGFTTGIPWAMAHSWSDVSRDGAYYSLQVFNHANGLNRLLIGSMNGGAPLTVASGPVGVLGWTTM